MLTRKLEKKYIKECFSEEKINIKSISLKKSSIKVEFKKPFYEGSGVDNDFWGAPSLIESFCIPFDRNGMTDIQIENEILEWCHEEQIQINQEAEDAIERDLNGYWDEDW